MIQFENYSDSRGNETFIRPFSDTVYAVDVRDGSVKSVPVPADAKICIINGNDYWVSPVGDFAIPTAAGVTAITAEFEGAGFVVTGVANLYFKSLINTQLTVSFYR